MRSIFSHVSGLDGRGVLYIYDICDYVSLHPVVHEQGSVTDRRNNRPTEALLCTHEEVAQN